MSLPAIQIDNPWITYEELRLTSLYEKGKRLDALFNIFFCVSGGGLLSGGLFAQGVSVRGVIVRGVIVRGVNIQVVNVPGGYCPGGYCPPTH